MKNRSDIANGKQSLFVTFDPQRCPEHVAYQAAESFSPVSMDEAFLNYLNSEIRVALMDDRMPDAHICRYDFEAGLLDPYTAPMLETNPQLLKRFIDEQHLQPLYDYPLREVYSYNEGEHIPDFRLLKQSMDPAKYPHERMQIIKNIDYQSSIENELYALETKKGMLLFPNTGRGFTQMKALLQYIADNYFTPVGAEIGFTRRWTLEKYTPYEDEVSKKTSAMFSLTRDTFLPDKAQWYRLGLNQNAFTDSDQHYLIDTSYDAFSDFVHYNLLDTSPRNYDIRGLLYIAECGTPDNIDRNEEFRNFSHRQSFKAMEIAARQASPDEQLLSEIRARKQHMAWFLLQRDYGVILPELKFKGPVPPEFKPRQARPRKKKNSVKPKIR